jgi:hypothetical protein
VNWRPGFIAIAPELYWRQKRGVDLDTWSDTDWQKGLELYATMIAMQAYATS